MTGKIIKGVGGFYSVHVPGIGIYECRARGVFRKKRIKPLIGDAVRIAVVDAETKVGNIEHIFERTNHLIRPTVANLDQAVIVFAVSQPAPNLNLLDRFLAVVAAKEIDALVCFNKADLVPAKQVDRLVAVYEKVGYTAVATSFVENTGIDTLKTELYGKTTVFAGPSGVGKSSILNLIQDETVLETGTVSEKIGRGKHTTRHAELLCFHENSYVVDTPGFSSLAIHEIGSERLKHCFREFDVHEPYCKFTGCNHLNEPDCGIRNAVTNGDIPETRYASYTQLMEELSTFRR